MVERICPSCSHGNPLDGRFCGKCGAPLERQLPARAGGGPLAVAGRNLPVTWRQLGKTVAISAAALAAEAGIAWLRHRVAAGQQIAGPARTARAVDDAARPAESVITIVSQRVVELWEGGDGQKRLVERSFWRRIDE